MKKRYACVSIIDKNSLQDIKELQNQIYKLTGSKLYSEEWPFHITVGIGNELNNSELFEISNKLKSINQKSFKIKIKDIFFKENQKLTKLNSKYTPYVIHLGIELNQNIIKLVKDINNILKEYDAFFEIFPYNPHLTIAGRDLTKEGFGKLKKEFKNKKFETTIKINSFSLVLSPGKENNLNKMKKVKTFKFKK